MPTMRSVLCLACIVSAAQAANSSHRNEPQWQRLAGASLKKAFSNAELGDGVHYSYRFHANGNFDGTEMGRPVRGTWRTSAQEVCWLWLQPAGSEECYTVERQGPEVRGARDGQERWWGQLTPFSGAPNKQVR